MRYQVYKCDVCEKKVESQPLPEGWYEIGWHQSKETFPIAELPWNVTHHFCSEHCMNEFMEPSISGELKGEK